MKKFRFFLGVVFVLFILTSAVAQTAQLKMHCLSVRMQQARASGAFGTLWRMNMTTLDFGINGELAPGFLVSPYTNSAFIELYEELTEEVFDGGIALNLPDNDADGNGIVDFFETVRPLAATAVSGAYSISDLGNGTLTATWQRESGSSSGFCVIRMNDFFNPSQTIEFIHSFELIEYGGIIQYTPGAGAVTGNLSLVRSNGTETLNGPASFAKAAVNGTDFLTLTNLHLTNNLSEVVSLFAPAEVHRDLVHGSNYTGVFEFKDGDLNTADDDYYTWMFLISDPNDSNGNGIPDFSDTPGGAPRKPLLSLARGTGDLLLTISGDVGRLHHIQQVDLLGATNWETALSVTLTNDPQTVTLALPGAPRFWRVAVSALP